MEKVRAVIVPRYENGRTKSFTAQSAASISLAASVEPVTGINCHISCHNHSHFQMLSSSITVIAVSSQPSHGFPHL